MTFCELCDLPTAQCPHGRPAVAKASQSTLKVKEIWISPNGLAHLPGCMHKDDDLSRWGQIEGDNVWGRLGNGEQIKATGGQSPDLVAHGRCRTCIEFGPW